MELLKIWYNLIIYCPCGCNRNYVYIFCLNSSQMGTFEKFYSIYLPNKMVLSKLALVKTKKWYISRIPQFS